MLRRGIFICTLPIPLSHEAAQGQPAAEGVRVEVVATASEYVPRYTTVSHPGHVYTNCLGSTSYFGRFSSYGDFGSFSGTADTNTHCSTTFSPPSQTTLTSYRRVIYTIARGDHALYLLPCTQTWKPTAKERVLLGLVHGLEAGTGNNSGTADKAEANAKGNWSECPAFAIGSTYTLTVRNTSDARLEGAAGGKANKLEYLSSTALPTTQPKGESSAQTQAANATAKVHVTSSPSGAEIYIDERFYGNTPTDLALAVGEHVVQITTGRRAWARTVQVTSGEITLNADVSDPGEEGDGTARPDGLPGVARDTAKNQMRQIIAALRKCPEDVSDFIRDDNFIDRHKGPPIILEWDIAKSESMRSEFQGFVRFNVPIRLEETEGAKQTPKLDKKYRDFTESLRRLKPEDLKSMFVIRYRYEFNLGSDAPELRKALVLTDAMKAFTPYEPEAGGSCWDKVAASFGEAGARPN